MEGDILVPGFMILEVSATMTRLLQVSLAISLGLGHIFLNFILCVDWVETGIFIYLFKKEGEREKTRGRETSM